MDDSTLPNSVRILLEESSLIHFCHLLFLAIGRQPLFWQLGIANLALTSFICNLPCSIGALRRNALYRGFCGEYTISMTVLTAVSSSGCCHAWTASTASLTASCTSF